MFGLSFFMSFSFGVKSGAFNLRKQSRQMLQSQNMMSLKRNMNE